MRKNMDVLIDTNIILDSFLRREPYCVQAEKIIELCLKGKIKGCLAAHTVTNLFFLMRKEKTTEERRELLLELCNVFTVISLDSTKIISALKNDKFDDFEDCLQDECAYDFNADYLITRNTKDFKHGKIKAIEPNEFLTIINKTD